MTILLEARGLAIPGRLEATDLDLRGGELTMLVGPNGAGKTSLLRAIAGIGDTPSDSMVAIGGQPLAGAPVAILSRLLSYMGSSRDVTWPLSSRDFVALGLANRVDSVATDVALAAVEATEFANRRIDRLSTGERSRVMLARALVAQAKLLLLDEPCANLDPQWLLAILDCLRREAERGAALLVSIHDLDLARRHADRVIVMEGGKIVADAEPGIALDAEIVQRVFGVRQEAGRWIRG